jgi:hypothetical protein
VLLIGGNKENVLGHGDKVAENAVVANGAAL